MSIKENKLDMFSYLLFHSLQDILRVLLLSSFGKLLAFPAVVWGQTHSAVYLGMTRLFIFTSNVVAFKGTKLKYFFSISQQ